MPLDAPAWWYPSENTSGLKAKALPWLLSPAAAIYGAVAGQRLARTPTYVPSLPVLCVGNFTAGGTGKTPLALDLARRLQALGERPAFLTRGYGGNVSGPYDVDADRDTAERTGDEPLLLARVAPTVVCRDRVLGAKHIERTDATIIVMDDGMQNPALAKSLTIAVIDGSRGIGNGWTLPSGPLRAPFTQQQELADAVVVNGGNVRQVQAELNDYAGPMLSGRLCPSAENLDLSGTAVVAFTGIGNPSRFSQTLAECGADVRDTLAFPDHHAFSDSDAEKILACAKRENATIVTTEKDVVRLRGMPPGSARDRLLERCCALAVRFRFLDADRARFDALLDMFVRQNCASRR